MRYIFAKIKMAWIVHTVLHPFLPFKSPSPPSLLPRPRSSPFILAIQRVRPRYSTCLTWLESLKVCWGNRLVPAPRYSKLQHQAPRTTHHARAPAPTSQLLSFERCCSALIAVFSAAQGNKPEKYQQYQHKTEHTQGNKPTIPRATNRRNTNSKPGAIPTAIPTNQRNPGQHTGEIPTARGLNNTTFATLLISSTAIIVKHRCCFVPKFCCSSKTKFQKDYLLLILLCV